MSDLDIGIPFSDTGTAPGRHRRRRTSDRGGGRSFVALVMVLATFGVLGLGGWWAYGQVQDLFTAPDYPGPGSGSVTIQVAEGDTATDVANTLYKADVVKSAKAFVDAAEENAASTGLQAGGYVLKKQMKAADALALMLDRSSRNITAFTVPEGRSVIQTLAIIAAKTELPLAELQAAAKDTVALGVPDWARANPAQPPVLEGFLFPATYEVQPGDTAARVLRAMVTKAKQVMADDQFLERAKSLNLTPWELLKVASLLESEGIQADFGQIARVVYNRLEQNIELRFDSTTQYWLELTGKGRKKILTNADLKNPANTYSTTLHQGLPPTPISNPGKVAIDAAVNPPPGDWLYFVVVDRSGASAFTNNLAEHNANVQRCKAIQRC
ncbi:MAG TPA: endolytic transglycosylase MltG [Cryptosporangiaceae bacterium]|nr:endolytic transglycosylase MltG [Cryptosporangiaceae bacterium]